MIEGIAEQIMNPEIVDEETREVAIYEPGQVPPQWANVPIPILRLAITFGLVIPEYTMRDYILYAAESKAGYESIIYWGTQGSYKSSRTLACSYWVYQDWDTVLEEIVLMPDASGMRDKDYMKRGFLQKLKMISRAEVAPCLAWDDITVNMPNSTYKTDIEQYGAVDSAWAAIRTKIKVMLLNCPLIDRLGRNIKDNISIECFIGRNRVEMIERFIRLPGLKQLESNFYKIPIEPVHQFDYRYVPSDVFKEYFDLRLEIAEFAIKKMGKAFKDEASVTQDLLTPFQAIEMTGLAPTTFTDLVRRNILSSEKINGKPYFKKTDVEALTELQKKFGKTLTKLNKEEKAEKSLARKSNKVPQEELRTE